MIGQVRVTSTSYETIVKVVARPDTKTAKAVEEAIAVAKACGRDLDLHAAGVAIMVSPDDTPEDVTSRLTRAAQGPDAPPVVPPH